MPDPSWNVMPGPLGHTNYNKNSHLSFTVLSLLPLLWKTFKNETRLGETITFGKLSWRWWYSYYHISLFDNCNIKWLKKIAVKKDKR